MKHCRFFAAVLATGALTLSMCAQETVTARFADPLSDGIETHAPVAVERQPEQLGLSDEPAEHKFFDRQQLLALYMHSGMRLVDTIKTCRELADGGREVWIPTQSCGGITAWQIGSIGLALGVGWMFHKHGHHRLERITPWVGTSASAAGWTKSVLNIH